VGPNEEPERDRDLTELEELERDLAALEHALEIADASGDEAAETKLARPLIAGTAGRAERSRPDEDERSE
jgi:hypothetical protein